MPTDYSPLLRTLCRAEVYFLMIGPAAVLAHAGELLPADQLPALPEQTALEIVPDPERQNLTRLAATLTTKISARLRVATTNNAQRGLPNHLDADLCAAEADPSRRQTERFGTARRRLTPARD